MDGRILYIEANSGISGDMFVAAMIDLGVDKDMLTRALRSIPAEGFEIEIKRKEKSGLDVCDFDVVLDADHDNHDHDMEYLYGHEQGDEGSMYEHEHGHTHEPEHVHEHGHTHEHEHTHKHKSYHAHEHHHRMLKDVFDIIDKTDITDGAKATAKKIFDIIAKAESKAHGVALDQVHFHEVGAIDSIADVIAAAVCVDSLSPDKVVVSPLSEGTGTVRTQHGILPIPVPAVTFIAADHQLVLRKSGLRGEFVTPTGAAIVAAIRTDESLPQTYRIEGVGMGGGKRDYDNAGILRAMWIREDK